MIALAPIALWWFDAPLHLGPSYAAIEWAAEPDRTVAVLCGLFAVRAAATWLGVAGGGMGGLFIPLVTQGAIVGSIFEHVVDSPNPRCSPRSASPPSSVPATAHLSPASPSLPRRPASPASSCPHSWPPPPHNWSMGGKSFSPYQRNERLPNVEPLSRLPVADIMSPSADTIDADLDLDAVVATMMHQNRRWAPVVDGSGYVGPHRRHRHLAGAHGASGRTSQPATSPAPMWRRPRRRHGRRRGRPDARRVTARPSQ